MSLSVVFMLVYKDFVGGHISSVECGDTRCVHLLFSSADSGKCKYQKLN